MGRSAQRQMRPGMETAAYTKPKDTDQVLVCDKCLKATCWYGEFMCDDSVSAGLKIMKVGDLRKLGLEHEDYWSDEYLIRIYGDADRKFRT
jgi:hypothetical protein